MVFHDQSDEMSDEVDRLRDAFIQAGIEGDHAVHAESGFQVQVFQVVQALQYR